MIVSVQIELTLFLQDDDVFVSISMEYVIQVYKHVLFVTCWLFNFQRCELQWCVYKGYREKQVPAHPNMWMERVSGVFYVSYIAMLKCHTIYLLVWFICYTAIRLDSNNN